MGSITYTYAKTIQLLQQEKVSLFDYPAAQKILRVRNRRWTPLFRARGLLSRAPEISNSL